MIGIMLIVFFMNLWIMSLNLTGLYQYQNFWVLASRISIGGYVNIYAFIFMIMFYASILPLLLSVFSLLRKSNWGFIVSMIVLLGFETLLIVFQSIFNYLSIFALILMIVNVVFIAGVFVFFILRMKIIQQTKDLDENEYEQKLKETKIPLYILWIDFVSVVVFLSTFIVPLYTILSSSPIYHAIIINVLFTGDMHIEMIAYFLANFALFLGIILYFAHCISSYFYDKKRFIQKSQTLITFISITILLFFVMGLSMQIYHAIQGRDVITFAFIPIFLMVVVIFIYAIFKGKFDAYNQTVYKETTIKYAKIEPLLYVVLLTTVTALMLLVSIIKINVVSSGYTDHISLTGLDIIRDYASLDPGYRLVAYLLVVTFIASGISLVVTMASYLSKYKQFNTIVKTATFVNVFFVFIIGISGYYFQIGQEIDRAVIINIFHFYGINLPSSLTYEYAISTDAIYLLIAAVALLVIMFIRKAFDREEISLADTNLLTSNETVGAEGSSQASDALEETIYTSFDPCPAFTELDMKLDYFKEDLENRNMVKVEKTTLYELIHFVVQYARNSRLHLSYTPKDIATFVAGLGASKLSILQGMSGTGKTSLPKIFSEAIYGNCDIIEVESSWKDKNELLGYYNEFSMKYTPKKFTLALYKAALNQDIFTFILLDEMNLSRIEYYFSDFLSLMENEKDEREIKLINIGLSRKVDGDDIEYIALNEGNTLKVPPNVWFVGTANRDESTFVISDKVYDRAQTINFTKRAPKVRQFSDPLTQQYYNYDIINDLFIQAKQDGDFDAEESELIKQVEVLLAPFNISFGNRILKQIEDFVNIYCACFPDEDVEAEAIEKILLSKVVAKLEVKTIDEKDKLELAFEQLNLNDCVDFIKRLDND